MMARRLSGWRGKGKPWRAPSAFDMATGAVMLLYVGCIAALLAVDLGYVRPRHFLGLFEAEDLRYAMRLSLVSATISACLSLIVAVPVAYALSRYRFPGRILFDTLVDVPMVLPPLVIGVSLLVFFQTPVGRLIENSGLRFVYTPAGVVLAQFVVVSAYAVRMLKAAFDDIDPRLEDVARTLGWSRGQAFVRVTLPMARNGLVAAAVVSWAHAIGLFGPLMVFSGTTRRKTEVLATSIYLELSLGNIEVALAITLLLVLFTMASLLVLKRLVGRGVV